MKNVIIYFGNIIYMATFSAKILVLILFGTTIQVQAQYEFFCPPGSFAIEVSLSNTDLLRLPMYRNSISSLIVEGDLIIGGTSAQEGLAPFLFTASINKRELVKILDINDVIAGQSSIKTGFCRGKNNALYAGTMSGELEGGHLLQIKIDNQGNIKCKDLGIPVKGEGVFSLTGNKEGTMLFGISFPGGLFFSFDIESGVTKTYSEIAPTKTELNQLGEFSIKPSSYLSKSLILDNQGLVYGSMPVNSLFCFNPKDKTFQIIKNCLPEVWGRNVLGQVESWAKSGEGKIYGGNAGDGQLFELDPATKKVKNLGKPAMMSRLRGLAYGRDGKLYGITGALPGYSHLFSYSEEVGFHDYGNPEFKMAIEGIDDGINWRGFQLGTIASSEDGKYIVLGEDEALSQLLIFTVEEK
jgi:hypothetical protein